MSEGITRGEYLRRMFLSACRAYEAGNMRTVEKISRAMKADGAEIVPRPGGGIRMVETAEAHRERIASEAKYYQNSWNGEGDPLGDVLRRHAEIMKEVPEQ